MAFKGDLEALVLGVLQGGSLHGYEMAKRIRQSSESALSVGEGQLYPALHRLEREGRRGDLGAAGWETGAEGVLLDADRPRRARSTAGRVGEVRPRGGRHPQPSAPEGGGGPWVSTSTGTSSKSSPCFEDKVREDRLHMTLQEVEDHLAESAGEMAVAGMGLEVAELAAIQRFGDPRRLAWEELRGSAAIVSLGGRLALGSVGLGCVLLVGSLLLWQSIDIFGAVAAGMAGLAAVFAFGCYLWGRSLAAPVGAMVAMCAAASGVVVGLRFVGNDNVTRREAPEALRAVESSLKSTRNQLALLEKGQRLFNQEPRPRVRA